MLLVTLLVIVTIGIGSVLAAIQQHHTSQNTRTVMDNLNFAMEDMARNIRLGTNVRCITDPSESVPVTDIDGNVVPQDCATTSYNKIALDDQNGNPVVYVISQPVGATPSQIYKQKGLDPAAVQLVSPPEVSMDFAKSGFTVRGSLPGDGGQPSVLIRLAGTIAYEGVKSTFAIETTVALRNLDS